MKLHVYHTISEVMMIPQINQFVLSDGLAGVRISEKNLVVETPRGSYFVAFSQAFIQLECWLNIFDLR